MAILTKNILKRIVFVFLILIMAYFVWKNVSMINFSLIIDHWPITLIIVGLAIIFLLVKSLMLFLTGNLFNVKEKYSHFIKIFSMGSFIELTTFSGKIGADGFKYFFWKDLSRKNRLALILFFRTADICGFVWLMLFLLLPLKLALAGFLPVTIFTGLQLQKNTQNYFPESFKQSLKNHWKTWLSVSFISIFSYAIIITQMSLVFNALGLKITKEILLFFLLSHGLGALSQLPFGLGVKDYSIYYLLNSFFSQSEIVLGMIWVRLFGELVVVLLGSFFAARYLKKDSV